MANGDRRRIRVWDPFVRIFHWSLAVAFAVAFLTEDELASVHEFAGYIVGALVATRVLWGFVGPRHARFADFVFRPATVLAYTKALVTFRAERHLGHSPAGGAMVVVLLVFLALSVATGIMADQGDGRGAGLAVVSSALADSDEGEREGSALGDVHAALSNFTFLLVLLHVGGVVLASFVHRENLARAMITGDKRA
jgi:cytochrome b